MAAVIEAVRIEELEEGDIILVEHRVHRVNIPLNLAITFIEGFSSGMLQGAPVPQRPIYGRLIR